MRRAAQKRGTRQTLVQVLEAYSAAAAPDDAVHHRGDLAVGRAARRTRRRRRRSCCSPTRALRSFRRTLRRSAASRSIKAAILGARQIRGQLDVPQSREIVIHYQSPRRRTMQHSLSRQRRTWSRRSGRIVTSCDIVAAGAQLPPTAMQPASTGARSHSPLAGLIDDPAAELARLQKRKAKTQQDLDEERSEVEEPEVRRQSAPAEIVAEVRTRIADFKRRDRARSSSRSRRVSALVARRRA